MTAAAFCGWFGMFAAGYDEARNREERDQAATGHDGTQLSHELSFFLFTLWVCQSCAECGPSSGASRTNTFPFPRNFVIVPQTVNQCPKDRSMNRKLSIAIICLLASATLGFSAEKKLWAKSFLNQKAPRFEVEKWLTATPDTKGKFVLIDYWATWCGPCRKAIPELNAFHKKFGDKLVVIGISDESEEAVKKMTEPKMDYFVAIDTKARMKKALEVQGIPHVIIMDPDGIVRWEGFPLLDGFELTEKVVADILAKPAAK
jgi:thiol-disulfide isomerase/thioredoxin